MVLSTLKPFADGTLAETLRVSRNTQHIAGHLHYIHMRPIWTATAFIWFIASATSIVILKCWYILLVYVSISDSLMHRQFTLNTAILEPLFMLIMILRVRL